MILLFCCIFALLCALPAQCRENEYWKPIDRQFDQLNLQMERLGSSGHMDSAEADRLLQRMRDALHGNPPKEARARALFWEATMGRHNSLRTSLELANEALLYVDTVRYEYDYYRILSLKAGLLLNMGDYYAAFTLYNKVTPYFEDIGNELQAVRCRGNTGLIYLFVEDYDAALPHLEVAQAYFKEHGMTDQYLLSTQQIAYVYESTGRIAEAADLLRSILHHFPDNGNPEIEYYCLSSYCRLMPDGAQKDSCMERMVQAALATGDWQCCMGALRNKAQYLYAKNQLDSAQIYADSVYSASRSKVLKFGQEGAVCELLARIYGDKRLYPQAYRFMARAMDYKDSVARAEAQGNIQRENVRREIVQQTFRLRELDQKAQAARRINWIVGVSLLLVLLLSAVIIYLLRKRTADERTQHEQEKEDLNMQLDHEKEKTDAKSRELSSKILMSMSKNEMLTGLSSYVAQAQDDGKMDRAVAGQIKNRIHDVLKEENDWEQFKIHFEEVHPSFFKKLKELHPGLTDNELRLCAYCKMNIPNKQIAKMLSVQPQSVIVARYRMRCKMNLPKETSLDDYLMNL